MVLKAKFALILVAVFVVTGCMQASNRPLGISISPSARPGEFFLGLGASPRQLLRVSKSGVIGTVRPNSILTNIVPAHGDSYWVTVGDESNEVLAMASEDLSVRRKFSNKAVSLASSPGGKLVAYVFL